MTTDTEQKRFHLERIIKHISEETTSACAVSSGISLVTSVEVLESEQEEKRDSEEDSDESKSVESESEEDSGNDKDSGAGLPPVQEQTPNIVITDSEIVVPVKISPRCDVCGLLHFKSYRCVTKISAPAYIRQAFDDNYQKLRVCRKCLTSKENCVENVAISNLARYSDRIRQMKIPLGMTSDRRTKPFEFVVRDLRQLKDAGRRSEISATSWLDLQTCSPHLDSTSQIPRKTLLQRFQVDDPVQKKLFLKELNLYSTDILKNIAGNGEVQEAGDVMNVLGNKQNNGDNVQMNLSQAEMNEKSLYHVAAKNVMATNVPEKKIGESFGARKGMSHDLVMNTKRAWKPNKKYEDLRKVGNPSIKKGMKQRGQKPAPKKETSAGDKTGETPEKIRTCGINCAVCDNHVQKSYSCCTPETAPEKFKHLFIGGIVRLKICRKCIPYKKVIKLDEPAVVKKKIKIKQKRGRKPTKVVKPTTVVKAISRDVSMVTVMKDDVKIHVKNEIDDAIVHAPFTAILNPEHTTAYNGAHSQVVNDLEKMDYM